MIHHLVWLNCGLSFVRDSFQFSYIWLLICRVHPAVYWYMDKPIQEDEWWVNNIDIYILANQIMQTKPPRWMAVVVVMGLNIESGKRLLGFSSTNFCVFQIWMNVFLILCLTHSWPEYKVEILFAFRNRRPFTNSILWLVLVDIVQLHQNNRGGTVRLKHPGLSRWHILSAAQCWLMLFRDIEVRCHSGAFHSTDITKTDYLVGDWAFLITRSTCLFSIYPIIFTVI